MRDSIKNFEYFNLYILKQNQRLLKFKTWLDNGEVKPDRVFAVETEIDATKYQVFEAKYSAGYDLEDIKSEFEELVKNMPKYWDRDYGYLDILTMISISIMYEIDDDLWDILVDLVNESKVGDWLLYYLISFRNKDVDYTKYELKMKKQYQFLKDFIDTDSKDILTFKNYLEKYWYTSHKEFGWYNLHLHKERLYTGYWSYESGAIIKILGINDIELKETQYFPYDLVHYRK